MANDVVDFVTRFIDERYEARTSDYSDLDCLLANLARPPPRESSELNALLETIEVAAGKGFDTANPGFVGYIPGEGLYGSRRDHRPREHPDE